MVNSLWAGLLEGLFPNHCVLCDLRCHRAHPLCSACEDELQANTSCCDRCAIPLARHSHPIPPGPVALRLCGRCQQSPPPFQRVIAPWLYCEELAHIIHRWKFHGEIRLTPLLASLWLQRAGTPEPVDLLVPVPLHWRRLWQRGFNQSELLCRQLQALDPAIAAAGLNQRAARRRRATSPQAGAGAARRASNMRGAFTVRGRYANLRVAIVDDVLTTGATASALATELRAAGADHVEVWCLARTPAPEA